MIYFYKHRSINDLSPQEINMMGYDGVFRYAIEHGLDPDALWYNIKSLEKDIKQMSVPQFDMTTPENAQLLNKWVSNYIDYFNSFANYDKQAYIILGNVGAGKTTYAKSIERTTGSIILDSDRFKMGEETNHGFYEGLTSLYKQPIDRERMQEPASEASKMTLENIADLGMNLIWPKTTTTYDKLEKQLDKLIKKNYDIHLILLEAPIEESANRNYYRYLLKEYSKAYTSNGKPERGRFVPVSVVTNIGDQTYETFAKAYNGKRFQSYKAFFNDRNHGNEEIDLATMGKD